MTKQNLTFTLIALIALVLLIVPFVRAQAPLHAAPALSPEQHMKLENAQLRLKLAYVALQQQQADFQAKLNAFNAECEAVVKATKQPEGTHCNAETLEFVPPAPKPKAEGKK